MFNYLLPIAGAFFFAILAFVVLYNRHVGRYTVYFSLFLLSGAAWSAALGIFFMTKSQPTVNATVAVLYISGICVAYSILMFALTAPTSRTTITSGRHFGALFFLPVAVMIGAILVPDFFYGQVQSGATGNSYRLVLYPYFIYALFFVAYIGSALYILRRKYLIAGRRDVQYEHGLKLVSVSLAFGTGVNAFTNLLLPLLGRYDYIWIGPLVVIPMAVIIWYAILRHGFFDTRLIVVRTIGYILSIATLGVVYVVLAYLISLVFLQGNSPHVIGLNPLNILYALVIAFIFQPVKNFFDRITNRIFYRNQYKPEEFFGLLSNVLSSTTDMKGMLERALDVITMTFKARQAFFFVSVHGRSHVSVGTRGFSPFLVSEAHALEKLAIDQRRGTAILTTQVGRDRQSYDILHKHGVSVLLPLWHDGSIIGYLALGEGMAGYTKRDVRVLSSIADEIIIAIQNALSLEEVRDVNTNLQERIDRATYSLRVSNDKLRQLDDAKDEFISMASHQLRTPLTSIKGYLSMLLEGDAGPVNDQQRKFLTEAFESSNRMTGIIGDFLNVSRLQTGKFMLEKTQINLADIAEREVEQLQNTARLRGLEIKYKKPKRFPLVVADQSKIEQVMMNFMDNALFYAPGSKTVEVELIEDGGKATFTVRDHGIGVPKTEQANLFTKFFRATNARRQRPDGTGVGIFLAKKVISAHHGDIIFKSKEGDGSTFGFTLPLMKQADQPAD